jgi:thiol:disulfide interchange protein DsbD
MYNTLVKKNLLLLSIFFFLSINAGAKAPTVTVNVIHSTDRYEVAKSYPALFRLSVESGWYIHGTLKEDYLIPTALSFTGTDGISVEDIVFPAPEKKRFEYTEKAVDVYSGTFYVQGLVKVGQESSIGLKSVTGELSYQACSKTSCLAPERVPVEIKLDIVTAGTITNRINQDIFSASRDKGTKGFRFDAGLLWVLAGIFLNGLVLNLNPCVYPLIPITISIFGGRSGKNRGNTILSAICYLSGISLTYSLMGILASYTGSMFGAALQYPPVLIFIALVMTALGFSFFGFWELELPSAITNMASKNYEGYFGVFFMGLTLGIVAAPCIGPFVISLLLHVGQKGEPLLGFLYFLVLGLGLGFPFCILALFSGSINRLPRSGDWMYWVRKVFGWILISMGYHYVRSLISDILIERIIFLILAVIAGIHLGLIDKTGKDLPYFKHIKRGVGSLIIFSALFYLYSAVDLEEGVKWTPYNQEVIETAVKNSKPVIIDVYADWCGPCKLMDKKVFTNPDLLKMSQNFVMTRIDITRKTEGQDDIKIRYSIEGAPTIMFFDNKGKELSQLRIESEVDADQFMTHMKKALEK